MPLAFVGGLYVGNDAQRYADQPIIDQLRAEVAAFQADAAPKLSESEYRRLEQCADSKLADQYSGQEVGVSNVLASSSPSAGPRAFTFWGYVAGTTRTAKFEARFGQDGALEECKRL